MHQFKQANPGLRTTLVAAGALALTLGLSACNKQDGGQTVGQKLDNAVAKTEQAAGEAKNDAKNAMASAESSMKGSGSEAKADAKEAANAVANTVDDMAITTSVSAALVKDPDLSAIKINVDTKNGAVSLSGPAPSAAAKERATSIAQGVKGVTSVTNNLTAPAG
ncbi:hypothetical protein RD110_16290 [Rhodoferax koreense]|uniref:BON domain-containing protein n=1 Tax=Rhodoferax koreensis TaxID=1842727 RepID=A0A1P8JXT9_9BURK|nr:BON domain-containing protein [Rhodoferax koreense]APW38566.1 hypothetical protein RD110_16290 [Rhodoferax koreense]